MDNLTGPCCDNGRLETPHLCQKQNTGSIAAEVVPVAYLQIALSDEQLRQLAAHIVERLKCLP